MKEEEGLYSTLHKKIHRQRIELRRLNRKLRAINDGIRYAASKTRAVVDDHRDLAEVDRREQIAAEVGA